MNKSKNENSQKENFFKKIGGSTMPLFAKIILRVVTIGCVAAALGFGAKYAFSEFTKIQIEKKRTTVERELIECSELVLYKMRYSDIIAIKKRRAVSSAYSLVRYAGIIRAGIEDISKSKIEISPDGKKLVVKIPHATLLGNEIYNQEVFDEKQGVFAKITTQEVFDEISAAKAEAEQEVLAEGLLDDADSRAVLVIKQLLSPIGFENVVVELE